MRFVGISPPGGIPDFGWFIGSRGLYILVAALAENLPHRSRENEFTDGRVDFSVKNQFYAVVKLLLTYPLSTHCVRIF